MMVLYSGTTCPYSHRCRFVLYEKGMDFEIKDIDLFSKPEDISVMNPYGQVPILVERDLILYESNIINEYIDERFPHPQLMPADPLMRARARLMLFNFEKELFVHVHVLESERAFSSCLSVPFMPRDSSMFTCANSSFSKLNRNSRTRARATGSPGISCGCGKRSSMYSLMMCDS